MILAVNMGETAAQVKDYVAQHGLSFPHVLDPDTQVASWFGVRGTPTLFVNGETYRGSISVEHLVEALETTAPAPVGPML